MAANEQATITLGVRNRREVQRDLDQVGRSLDAVGREVRGLDGYADHADRALRDLAADADRNMRLMSGDVGLAVDTMGRDLRRIGDDTGRASRDLHELAVDAERSARRMERAFDDVSFPEVGGGRRSAGAEGAKAGAVASGLFSLADPLLEASGLTGLIDRGVEPITLSGDVDRVAALLNVPDRNIAGLIEDLQTRRGLTGEEILPAIQATGQLLPDNVLSRLDREGILDTVDQLLALDEAGLGLDQTAQALGQLSAAFGTTDLPGLLDSFAAIAQTAGPGVADEVVEAAHEYSSAAAALGLSVDQYLGVLSAGAAPGSGLFSVDKVGDALLEAQTLLTAESDQVAAALTELGLAAQATQQALAVGDPAAFGSIIQALRGVEDPVRQRTLFEELFGSPGTDLADLDALLQVLDTNQQALQASTGLAEQLADQLNATTSQDIFGAVSRLRELFPFSSVGDAGGDDPFGARARAVSRGDISNVVNVTINPVLNTGVVADRASITRLFRDHVELIAREVDRHLERHTVFAQGRRYGGL